MSRYCTRTCTRTVRVQYVVVVQGGSTSGITTLYFRTFVLPYFRTVRVQYIRNFVRILYGSTSGSTSVPSKVHVLEVGARVQLYIALTLYSTLTYLLYCTKVPLEVQRCTVVHTEVQLLPEVIPKVAIKNYVVQYVAMYLRTKVLQYVDIVQLYMCVDRYTKSSLISTRTVRVEQFRTFALPKVPSVQRSCTVRPEVRVQYASCTEDLQYGVLHACVVVQMCTFVLSHNVYHTCRAYSCTRKYEGTFVQRTDLVSFTCTCMYVYVYVCSCTRTRTVHVHVQILQCSAHTEQITFRNLQE